MEADVFSLAEQASIIVTAGALHDEPDRTLVSCSGALFMSMTKGNVPCIG
jgi:hypothetical protein